jgi:hypothetical protein
MSNMVDVNNRLLDYEHAMLTDEETVELFQELVDTGLAWSLQGSYGRTARDLIEAGEVSVPQLDRNDPEYYQDPDDYRDNHVD